MAYLFRFPRTRRVVFRSGSVMMFQFDILLNVYNENQQSRLFCWRPQRCEGHTPSLFTTRGPNASSEIVVPTLSSVDSCATPSGEGSFNLSSVGALPASSLAMNAFGTNPGAKQTSTSPSKSSDLERVVTWVKLGLTTRRGAPTEESWLGACILCLMTERLC